MAARTAPTAFLQQKGYTIIVSKITPTLGRLTPGRKGRCKFMLLCEALAATPTDMLLVVMDENKKELFDGLVCEVGNALAARPIKGLGVFSDYSNCFQAVVAAHIDVDSRQSLQAISTTQDEPKQRGKRVVKSFDSPVDLPTMLSVYDLMDFLQCGQVQAYQLTHSVGFPSLKVGGTIQIPKYLFIKWLEDQAKKQIL